MFDNYRIPKDYLLNKTGDVTDEGKYVSPFSDPNKRFGEYKVKGQSCCGKSWSLVIINFAWMI